MNRPVKCGIMYPYFTGFSFIKLFLVASHSFINCSMNESRNAFAHLLGMSFDGGAFLSCETNF